jgi:hypothetical protein
MERLHATHRVSRSKATQLAKAETQGTSASSFLPR